LDSQGHHKNKQLPSPTGSIDEVTESNENIASGADETKTEESEQESTDGGTLHNDTSHEDKEDHPNNEKKRSLLQVSLSRTLLKVMRILLVPTTRERLFPSWIRRGVGMQVLSSNKK